jgi:opacity protein-like surface antigen
MRVFLTLATAAVTALTAVAAAGAVPPVQDTFTAHVVDVDTETCSFPVARDFVFANNATAFFDGEGNITKLQLHQSTVGTLTANGITLRVNIRETIMVEFAGGIPVTAKHVGQLDYIGGSRGQPVFHRTGQAVFQVIGGFDGPLIARHGLRDDFDPIAFCAAFS